MRALLIDPVAQTITEIDIDGGLTAIKTALECMWIDVKSVGRDQTNMPLDLICDDEGRLAEGKRCFRLGGPLGLLIAGRALLMSHDEIGASTSTAMLPEHAMVALEWMPEGFDYTPPPPLVVGFKSFEMMKFLLPTS